MVTDHLDSVAKIKDTDVMTVMPTESSRNVRPPKLSQEDKENMKCMTRIQERSETMWRQDEDRACTISTEEGARPASLTPA